MSNLVTFEELKEATGYMRAGDIERWLTERGVPFFHGKQGFVFTTPQQMNEALSVVKKQKAIIEFGGR